MVTPAGGGNCGEEAAEEGRQDADYGDPTATGIAAATQQAEGEEAEEGAVGVRGNGIDGINHAGAVQRTEGKDSAQNRAAHEDVDATAQALVRRLTEEIDTHGGGQRSEGAIGAGEGGSNDAKGEEHQRALT